MYLDKTFDISVCNFSFSLKNPEEHINIDWKVRQIFIDDVKSKIQIRKDPDCGPWIEYPQLDTFDLYTTSTDDEGNKSFTKFKSNILEKSR